MCCISLAAFPILAAAAHKHKPGGQMLQQSGCCCCYDQRELASQLQSRPAARSAQAHSGGVWMQLGLPDTLLLRLFPGDRGQSSPRQHGCCCCRALLCVSWQGRVL